jgi:hypothetical protein
MIVDHDGFHESLFVEYDSKRLAAGGGQEEGLDIMRGRQPLVHR